MRIAFKAWGSPALPQISDILWREKPMHRHSRLIGTCGTKWLLPWKAAINAICLNTSHCRKPVIIERYIALPFIDFKRPQLADNIKIARFSLNLVTQLPLLGWCEYRNFELHISPNITKQSFKIKIYLTQCVQRWLIEGAENITAHTASGKININRLQAVAIIRCIKPHCLDIDRRSLIIACRQINDPARTFDFHRTAAQHQARLCVFQYR